MVRILEAGAITNRESRLYICDNYPAVCDAHPRGTGCCERGSTNAASMDNSSICIMSVLLSTGERISWCISPRQGGVPTGKRDMCMLRKIDNVAT